MNSKLFGQLKDILIAAAIAMLIWLYAEAENLTPSKVNFQIKLIPANENIYISPQDRIISVSMDYISSTGQTSIINEKLKNQPIEIKISPDPDPSSITQNINLLYEIEHSSQYKGLAFNIEKLSPPRKSVDVLQLVTIDCPIQITADTNAYIKSDSIKHAPNATLNAKITIPKSLEKQFENQSLIANITKDTKLDDNNIATLDLKLPDSITDANTSDFQIKIEPASIPVTYQKNSKTLDKQILKIKFELEQNIQNKYTIELHPNNEIIDEIVFTGPIDAINKIINDQKNGETPLFARIAIEDQKTINQYITAQARPDQEKKGYSRILAKIIAPDGIEKAPISVSVFIKITPKK